MPLELPYKRPYLSSFACSKKKFKKLINLVSATINVLLAGSWETVSAKDVTKSKKQKAPFSGGMALFTSNTKRMLRSQNYQCVICGSRNHSNGEVRGNCVRPAIMGLVSLKTR